MALSGVALVKAVLSGDTVVLVGGPQRQELLVGLSGLIAPRVARSNQQQDEPYGWHSREFLRSLLIGRQVRFRVDYKNERIGRQFATLWVQEPSTSASAASAAAATDSSVNRKVVAAGWARVISPEQGKAAGADASELEVLGAIAAAAVTAGLGLHSANPAAAVGTTPRTTACVPATRDVTWTLTPESAAALAPTLTAAGGVAAVVEQVVNGATLRVFLPAYSTMATFSFAAVQAPRAPQATPAPGAAPTASAGGAGGSGAAKPASAAAAAAAPAAPGTAAAQSAAADALGAESKAFTEARLLHREVTLHVGGADKYGNLIGRCEHPAGDIAAELLAAGLARIADWSASYTSPSQLGALRAAERAAKAAKLKTWAAYEAPKISGARLYEGRVTEVVSGDTLVVLTNPKRPEGTAADERRVSLSSIRAPRMGNARRGESDAPWAWESREWLRRNLVGRDVTVSVEYSRAPAPGTDAPGGGAGGAGGEGPQQVRQFATVTALSRKGEPINFAVGLVSEGLAEVVRHRAEEERSAAYDQLLEAETAAKAAKKGMFSGKDAPVHRIADLSLDAAKAKAHFPFLQRAHTMKGVVDFVFAGGRVKLLLPSENCSIIFGVAGVRCPAVAKPASKGPDGRTRPGRDAEPLGPDALAFMREAVLQQEVEIEAEDVDKNGCILGPMWTGKGGARKNVGVELLRRGLGRAAYPAVERIRDSADLIAAAEEAKAAVRGVWKYAPAKGAEEEEEDGGAAAASGGGGGAGAGAGAGSGGATSTSGSGGIDSGAPFRAVLADITDGNKFTIQVESDRERIEALEGYVAGLEHSHAAVHDVKKGKLVACLFDDGSGGGQRWYRGRIEGKHKIEAGDRPVTAEEAGLERWDVYFTEYGNSDVATILRMRPLPAPYDAWPAMARPAQLALLRVPGLKDEYGMDAARYLSDEAFGKMLAVRSHGRTPEGVLQLALYDEDSGACVNESMVAAGLARVARTEARRIRRRAAAGPGSGAEKDIELLQRLETAQSGALRSRRGMFRYGDVGDSDVEERGAGRPAPPGAAASSGSGPAAAAPKATSGAWARK